MYALDMNKKIISIILSIFMLTACSSGSSIEEIAARATESDQSLWDDEDYKTIAAKSCLELKAANDKSLGELLYNWEPLSYEFLLVSQTTIPLNDHPKWGPIRDLTIALLTNAISRSQGGDGYEVPSIATSASFELCQELGGDLFSGLED